MFMKFFKNIFKKNKEEKIQITFNGINLTNDINTDELTKEIEKNEFKRIKDEDLDILLEKLKNEERRVLVVDKKSKCSSILDNACFKGFFFSFNIYYIYEVEEKGDKKLKILINTGEVAKFFNVNNELKEKLISYLKK